MTDLEIKGAICCPWLVFRMNLKRLPLTSILQTIKMLQYRADWVCTASCGLKLFSGIHLESQRWRFPLDRPVEKGNAQQHRTSGFWSRKKLNKRIKIFAMFRKALIVLCALIQLA